MAVPGVVAAKQIVVGDGHSFALLGDGTAHCWGANARGQLGDGGLQSRAVPAPVYAFP